MYLCAFKYEIFHFTFWNTKFGGYGTEKKLVTGIQCGSLGLFLFLQFLLQKSQYQVQDSSSSCLQKHSTCLSFNESPTFAAPLALRAAA